MDFKLDETINVKKQMVFGIGWQSLATIVKTISSFVILLLLAYFLGPNAYGIIGMTEAFIVLLLVFTTLGFDTTIIQEKEIDQTILSTLFWFNIFLSSILTICAILFSPLLGNFYNELKVIPVFRILSFNLLLEGLTVVQRGILKRTLHFDKLAIIDIFSSIISGIVAVILASQGFGYWSLVFQQLVSRLVLLIGYWSTSTWRPSFIFNYEETKNCINFSYNLIFYNLLNFSTTKIDAILIGRFLGAEQLGYYTFAREIVIKPSSLIINIVIQTLYPVLSQVKNDLEKVRIIFKKTIYILLFTLGPVIILGAIVVTFFIPYQLGSKWIPAIPIIYVWCFGVLRGILTSQGGILFFVGGRPDISWKYQLIALPLVVLGVIAGIKWGAIGIAVGYTFAQSVISFLGLYLSLKIIKQNIREYIFNFKLVYLALFAQLVFGFSLIKILQFIHIPFYINIFITISTSALLYLVILYKYDFFGRGFLLNLISDMGKSKNRIVSSIGSIILTLLCRYKFI